MRDFMKGGLFCLFISGLGTCALAAISGCVVVLAVSPLFSTRQFEMLFGMAMVFWTGLGTAVLCAIAFAALDYVELKFPAANPKQVEKGKESAEISKSLSRKAA